MAVRDRLVRIKVIYDEPKEMADKGSYKVFSWGIKLEDGTYCNISGTAKDLESFKDKAEDKFYVGKDEKIQVGGTYKVYEESTDGAEKYWNVTAFVKIDAQAMHLENPKREEVSDSPNGGGGASKLPTVHDYEMKRSLQILRGQCFNNAATVCSGRDGTTARHIFDFAEDLYNEAMKRNWLK